MADRPPLTSPQVLDRAVFVLELAARTSTPVDALAAVQHMLGDLDAAELRRVVACLAVNAVRAMPPVDAARWIERLSLEHLVILGSADGA
jgi:hypothetical protein